jgi:hypothetical protein
LVTIIEFLPRRDLSVVGDGCIDQSRQPLRLIRRERHSCDENGASWNEGIDPYEVKRAPADAVRHQRLVSPYSDELAEVGDDLGLLRRLGHGAMISADGGASQMAEAARAYPDRFSFPCLFA